MPDEAPPLRRPADSIVPNPEGFVGPPESYGGLVSRLRARPRFDALRTISSHGGVEGYVHDPATTAWGDVWRDVVKPLRASSAGASGSLADAPGVADAERALVARGAKSLAMLGILGWLNYPWVRSLFGGGSAAKRRPARRRAPRRGEKRAARSPVLAAMLDAKARSDRRDYRGKHAIMRRLMVEDPGAFVVDDDRGHFVGVTHSDLGFKMHLPRTLVPEGVRRVVPPGVEKAASVATVAVASGKKRRARALVPASGRGAALIPVDPDAVLGEALDGLRARRAKKTKRTALDSYQSVPALVAERVRAGDGSPVPADVDPDAPEAIAAKAAAAVLDAGIGRKRGVTPAGGGRGRLVEHRWRLRDPASAEAVPLGDAVRALDGLLGGGVALADDGRTLTWRERLPAGELPSGFVLEPVGRRYAAALGGRSWLDDAGLDHGVVDVADERAAAFGKTAAPTDVTGMFAPSIPVDAFNNAVWSDAAMGVNAFGTRPAFGPSDSRLHTPPAVAATVSGLVAGAGAARDSGRVSPWDVARAAGSAAGSGLLGGLALGRTVGALAGLSDEGQKRLQDVGLWGGMLAGAVRATFGGR